MTSWFVPPIVISIALLVLVADYAAMGAMS
jgi:hypothetical protein